MNRLRPAEEDGFTLVELLVSMIILGIFFSVFTGVIVKVFDTTRSQQNRSIAVDSSRNIVQVLDRQVRYANGIYAPQTSPGGMRYVVFSARSRQGVDSCYQWQVTPAGVMRWATWTQGAPGALSFSTAATNIGQSGTSEIFSLGDAVASIQTRQGLTLTFQSGKSAGKDGSATRVTFTAVNTASAGLPATLVCQEKNPS